MIYLSGNLVNSRIIEHRVNLSIEMVGEDFLEEELEYLVSCLYK